MAILDYNRGVEVANCSLTHVGEVGFVVQGQTDGINATGGNYPIDTRIHHNFVYEVATKMRGGSFFFQALAARTELDHNVALNGPRAGVRDRDNRRLYRLPSDACSVAHKRPPPGRVPAGAKSAMRFCVVSQMHVTLFLFGGPVCPLSIPMYTHRSTSTMGWAAATTSTTTSSGTLYASPPTTGTRTLGIA